uniref:Zn-finger in Ran binding protein n=1 Tax=Musca domestica TaxID=7370 RepID=T1PJB4_MUSDO
MPNLLNPANGAGGPGNGTPGPQGTGAGGNGGTGGWNLAPNHFHQHHLQQQQQQQKLLMQQRAGELVNAATNNAASGGASVIAQYIPNTTSNSNTTTTTIMRQPTLTPIGAATVTHNNSTGQMIYTTTSAGDVIGTATGSQKIYLQKAPVSLGSSTTTQGVNIINTSSGQQLTVQNIAGVQHINATGNGSNATAGPLIVTTSARNAVQQLTQQQMVGQPTQQIVWRQLGSTNVTTTPAGMLAGATTAVTNADGTVTATMESGNKIVWTNRPAQKRLLNGPESTDINKVLLNRKLSQRKIITQAHQQILQQQQQQQHLQQQQQQQSPLSYQPPPTASHHSDFIPSSSSSSGTYNGLIDSDTDNGDYDDDDDEEQIEHWECSMCTFRNHPQLNICECCDNVRILPEPVLSREDIHITLSPGENRIIHSWIVS